MNTIVTLAIKDEEHKVSKTVSDTLSFIIALTVSNPTREEIHFGLTFISIIIFLIFIIAVFTFSISFDYRYLISDHFSFFIFYMLPFIFTFSINAFQQAYIRVDDDGWYSVNYIAVFAHSVFTFLVTLTALFSFLSPYICIHPFFQRNLASEFVVLFSYLVAIHIDSYYYNAGRSTEIARIIISICVATFCVIVPPFYNREVTAVFFSFSIFVTCVSLSLLIKPGMYFFCLYYLLIGAFVSFLVYYVIYPLIIKKVFPRREIFYEYFFGHTKKVKTLLDNLTDPTEIHPSILSDVIIIAFNLDSPSLPRLISFYISSKKLNFVEMIHMWIISHLYYSAHGNTNSSKSCRNDVSKEKDKINELKKDFWNSAWLSDITSLQKIAGKMGRKKMHMHLVRQYHDDIFYNVFPSVYKDKDTFLHKIPKEFPKDKTKKQKILRYIGTHEIVLFFTLLLVFGFLLLSLIVLLSQRRSGQAYEDFLEFSYEFYVYHLRDIVSSPPDRLYNLFQKVVTTNIETLHDFYIDSGFVDSFLIYYDEFTSLDYFPIESFSEFLELYDDTLLNYTSVFQTIIDEKYNLLYQTSVIFYGVVFLSSIILLIISIFALYRAMKKFYNKFRYIQKKSIIKVASSLDFNPELNKFDRFWIERSFNVFTSYPITITIYALYFVFSLILIGVVLDSSDFNTEYLYNALYQIRINANSQRVSVNLIANAYQESNDALNVAQFYVNNFLSDPNLHDLMVNFPQSFYDLVGSVLFDPNLNNSVSLNDTYVVVMEIWSLVNENLRIVPYNQILHYQRFLSYIILICIFTGTFWLIIFKLKPLSIMECKMGRSLYKEVKDIDKKDQESNIYRHLSSNINPQIFEEIYQEVDEFSEVGDSLFIENHLKQKEDKIKNEKKNKIVNEKWNMSNMPLIIIIIDKNFKVRYQTNLAKDFTKVNEGEDFSKASPNVGTKVISEIKEKFDTFKQNFTYNNNPVFISLPNEKKENATSENLLQSLIMTPFYTNSKRKKTLDYVLIAGSNEPPNASIEIEKKYSRIFYSIYPKFIQLNQTFPYEISSNGRPFFLIFFKLLGFNEWCDQTDLHIVDRFRKDVSKCCDHLLQDESNFCRVRENSDFIVMMMNRETKLSIWKILEVCSDFSCTVLENIQKLAVQYNATNVRGCVLLFKVKEPNYFFISRKCGRTDFKSDVIFAGEARFANCKPDIVNYTSQKKELKVSNTTKLKTCRTPDGEEYDILIVV